MGNKFLKEPTEPVDVSEKTVGELLSAMLKTGFQGRKLAECVEVWRDMLREEKITIMMGLSGAMVPAGMRHVLAYIARNRMIDVLVSTGANLYHDVHEALGREHWVGTHVIDDAELFKSRIDRIYDVFADEREFLKTDLFLENEFFPTFEDRVYSSREVCYLLGKKLREVEKDESVLGAAYEAGVPVFCPAIGDSMIGISAMFAKLKHKRNFVFDHLQDVEESGWMTAKSGVTGVIYIGGGVPKNFIQQTAVFANYMLSRKYLVSDEPVWDGVDQSHKYAIQITTDSPQWGGLSGCTFEEAKSWGKVSTHAKKAICFSDATIALPLIVHGLLKDTPKRKFVPRFEFGNQRKLEYAEF
ncbi:MAG: deoxyhypusine synthase [Candidatus Micrarchaeota archaeon]